MVLTETGALVQRPIPTLSCFFQPETSKSTFSKQPGAKPPVATLSRSIDQVFQTFGLPATPCDAKFQHYKNSTKQTFKGRLRRVQYNHILGGVITPIALIINAFAGFSLPPELREATSLVPALQSNWLIMHVTVIMLSYAAILVGCIFSFVFLLFDLYEQLRDCLIPTLKTLKSRLRLSLREGRLRRVFANRSGPSDQPTLKKGPLRLSLREENVVPDEALISTPSLSRNIQSNFNFPNLGLKSTKKAIAARLPDGSSSETARRSRPYRVGVLQLPKRAGFAYPFGKEFNSASEIQNILDNLSYRTISIGFLLLTIGIFSGAVWANEAWGSYWSWDPKETWALITWFIFAIYLHARIQLNWSPKKTAMIACCGFVVVWICYLGVNLFGQGLHSYGFINVTRGDL
jgi:ABC-type transport system involved in cytochrome c biogenesis permease subunit